MPPTVILIRHAQALHNIASDWTIHDPPLSELGERQCAELQESLKKEKIANEVELIVVSAMRRTLQTAQLGLAWLIERGVRVEPHAGWQENADKPCDTGSPISVMQKEFPQFPFSTVDPRYPDKTHPSPSQNPYAFTRTAILARGQSVLHDLYSRPEKVIAVVSHSGFMRAAVCNRRFENADWRVFEFDEERMKKKGKGDGEGMFYLREWEITEERGGGMGRSEKGIFGPRENDFPVEEAEGGERKVEEEETAEVPKKT